MRKKASIPLVFILLAGACLCGCSNPSQSLLTQAKNMEQISTDSVLFYLQQIKQPHRLSPNERADYCLLFYRALLWKTGNPDDSLLHASIDAYSQTRQASQWIEARMEQAASYLYKGQADSALLYTHRMEEEKLLSNDTLKARFYSIRRSAYSQQKQYDAAARMADSALLFARRIKDTLSIYNAAASRLYLLERTNAAKETIISGYQGLTDELKNSGKHGFLCFNATTELINYLLRQGEYGNILQFDEQLTRYRYRDAVPYLFLLRGDIHTALHHVDSARYYYTRASESTSPYIAAEANARLFRLINAEENPQQAYYLKQKENSIKANIFTHIEGELQSKKFNELKLQNQLYQLNIEQQKKEMWLMGVAIILLLLGMVALFFYQHEKKKRLVSEQKLREEQIEEEARRLQHENQLLHKEAELNTLREKEMLLRHKESELREAIFRRITFFRKLPSLRNETTDGHPNNRKIEVTEAEWNEVKSAVNDGFDNFAVRLHEAYPLLTEKEICFCCLVKIKVNMQDLSDVYCVSKAAITKRKYRIKTEKMNITDDNISLDMLLQSF